MSAPTPAPGDDRPREGYYPDPSIPGYVRYWNGAAWVPGTSRPAPSDGEPLTPPPGAAPARPSVEETGPHFFDEDPQPSAGDPYGGRPEPASAWGADRSRQSGFGGDQDRRVSWGAPQGADPGLPADAPAQPDGRSPSTDGTATIPPAQPEGASGSSGSSGGSSGSSGSSSDVDSGGTFVFRRQAGGSGGSGRTADEGTMTFRAMSPRTGRQSGSPGAQPGGTGPSAGSSPSAAAGGAAGAGGTGAQGSGAAAPAGGTGSPGFGGGKAAVERAAAVQARAQARAGAAEAGQGSGAPVGTQAGRGGAGVQQPPASAAPSALSGPQQAAPGVPRQAGAGGPQRAAGVPQPSAASAQQAAAPIATPMTTGAGGGQPSWAQQVHRLAGASGEDQPVAPWKPPVEDVFQAAARLRAAARPAGLGRRLAARLIDTVVLAGVTAVAAVPLGVKAADHVTEKIDAAKLSGRTVTVWLLDGTTSVYLGIVLAVLLVSGVLYEVLPTAKWGRTLGKKLLGLEVRDIEAHEPPAFGAALRRWIVYSVPGLLGIGVVGVVWGLFDRPWHQCWHDKAAHTFVSD